MTTTAVIVPARVDSSRLPRKVMMTLAGIPGLAHVLGRCQAIDDPDTLKTLAFEITQARAELLTEMLLEPPKVAKGTVLDIIT